MSSRRSPRAADTPRVNAARQTDELINLVNAMVKNKKGTAAPETATESVLKSSQKAKPVDALKAFGLTVDVVDKLKNRDSVNGIIPIQELVDAGNAVLLNDSAKLVKVVEAGAENAGANDNYTRMGNADKFAAFSFLTEDEINWCATKMGYSRSSVKTNPAYAAIVAKIDAYTPTIALLKGNTAAIATIEAEIKKLHEILQTVPKTIANDKKATPAERTVALSDMVNVVEKLARAKTAVAYWKANAALPNAAFWISYWTAQYDSESYSKLKKARCSNKVDSDKLRPAIVNANEQIVKQL